MANRRIWCAEDIALGMELLTEIRDSSEDRVNATEIAAKEFGMEPASFNALIHHARNNGFDAYPLRESNEH